MAGQFSGAHHGGTVEQTRKVCGNVLKSKIMIISACQMAARWASGSEENGTINWTSRRLSAMKRTGRPVWWYTLRVRGAGSLCR